MNIDFGINEKDRAEIANGLSNRLAGTYCLYLNNTTFNGM